MGEGVGEGNKLFSMTFGPKACTLRNLVLAKSKSREEEQGQAGPCVVILSRSPARSQADLGLVCTQDRGRG